MVTHADVADRLLWLLAVAVLYGLVLGVIVLVGLFGGAL